MFQMFGRELREVMMLAIWDENGLNTRRLIAIEQAALGKIPVSAVEPMDEEDREYFDNTVKQLDELKAAGIENPYFSIPQM
jgi:hypothetical protein